MERVYPPPYIQGPQQDRSDDRQGAPESGAAYRFDARVSAEANGHKGLLLRQTLTVGLHSRADHSVSGPMSPENCNKGFCHDQHLEVRPLWLCPQRRRSAIILPGLRRRQKSFFAFGNQKSGCRKTDDQCMAMQHLRPYRRGTCRTGILPGMRCSGSTFPSIRKG